MTKAKNLIVTLPKSQYRVLGVKKPAPRKLVVYRNIAAIVGVSMLFAIGIAL